jgi:hypothetical protein
VSSSSSSSGGVNDNSGNAATKDQTSTVTWSGKVQVYHRNDPSREPSMSGTIPTEATPAAASSLNSNKHCRNDSYYSDQSKNDPWNSVLSPSQRHAFENFQQTASVLSSSRTSTTTSPSSSFLTSGDTFSSRYHSSRYKHVSSQFVHSSNRYKEDFNNDRVMTWDLQEEEEEEEGEDHDDLVYWQDAEDSQRKREEKKRRRQEEYSKSLHCDLTNYWNEFLGVSALAPPSSRDTKADTSPSHAQQSQSGNDAIREETTHQDDFTRVATQAEMARHRALSALHWMQFFMPPHPWNNMYSAPLPFRRWCSDQEQQKEQPMDQAMFYSYHAGMNPVASGSQSFCSMTEMSMGITREWREDVLSDKLRKWMEDCDCVKGCQILTDGDQALFGGLAASVLEELSDECKSATKFSVVVHDGDDFHMDKGGTAKSTLQENELAYWRSENKAVCDFRNDLSQGLLLHGVASNSDLVLPLSLSRCWKSLDKKDKWSNLFEASAAAAIALETATLPFRFARGTPKSKSKIGIASGYFQGSSSLEDDDMFPIADALTFHEYISSLKPSSHRHIMVEMSCLLHSISPMQVHQSLLQGTSIERRQLEQVRNSHRDSYYRRTRGRDIDPGLWMEDYGPNGGILTSLSPINSEISSRSLHRHFALASSFRALPSTVGDIVSTYTTSLMEGEIIRHRPLSSVASVAAQSFHALTDPSTSCSAGSYWNTIVGSQTTRTFQPISVIGNTTRIHGHLNSTGNGLKTALSQKYKGYLRRDSMAGLAPELEDCEEAQESCLSLRDLYEPPMSGHDSEEEGVYYEDNYD